MKNRLILESKKIKTKVNRILFNKSKINIVISNIDGFPNPYVHLMWYDKKDNFTEQALSLIDLQITTNSHIKNIVFNNNNEKYLSFVHKFIDDKEYNVKYIIYFNIKKEYDILKKEITKSLNESKIKYKIITDKQTFIMNANLKLGKV